MIIPFCYNIAKNSAAKGESDVLKDNFEELKSAIADFYRVTGIMIVLYDQHGNAIYSCPTQCNPFCAEVRKTDKLYSRCIECDNAGLERCKRDKALHIYECHMGLIEAISPIMEFDRILGYLMMGQVLPENGAQKVRERIQALPDSIPTSKQALMYALGEMNSFSKETLRSAAKIMDMCTCYISTNQFLTFSPEAVIYQIDRYINDRLNDPELSTESICRHFLISRSALYTLSKNAFGIGISDRIRYLRIEKAKRLLLLRSKSVAEISRECGFNEPNYFTKTFKKATGILPKDYAKAEDK